MFDGMLVTLTNTHTKSFKNLIKSFPANLVLNARGAFATFSTTELTTGFMEAVRQEAAVCNQAPEPTAVAICSFWLPIRP
jgi:hypothetical protein